MKRRKLNKKSPRQILKDEIGRLHREILKIERGEVCEICGSTSRPLGRFHIVRVSRAPRLEYRSENVLLSCWMPCHYNWHTLGHNDPKNKKTVDRIIELRGPNYDADIMKINSFMEQHSMFYLLKLERYMRDRYNNLFTGAVVIQRRPVC